MRASALPLTLLALLLPGEASAQSGAPDSIPAALAPPASTPHLLELADSSAIVVTTTLLIDAGTSTDPEGLEGLTWIVVDAHARALRQLPGVLEVDAVTTRGSIRLTLSTTPEAAEAAHSALHAVDTMLSGLAPALEAARRRFGFTAETPVSEVEVEAARLFAGFGSPWARASRGSVETLSAISPTTAARRWAELFEEADAREVRLGPPGALEAPVPTSTLPTPQPAGAAAPAWSTEDRIRIVREVTNIWIVAAFPLPSDLGRTSLDHLVHRIDEILDPVPGDPGLIAAGTEVVKLPAGEVLIVRATVLPSAALRWEERIGSLPADITPPFDPEFFRWERRRFRAHLLLRDADPALRSQRIASDLLTSGGVRALAQEAWALEPDDLADAAGRLGPPRILVFGPDLGDPNAPAGANSPQR